jgi:hypothetical protein
MVGGKTMSWLLWPVKPLWDLLASVLRLTGRLVGVVLAVALMLVGIVLIATVVAAPLGIPLFLLGLLLMIRCLF